MRAEIDKRAMTLLAGGHMATDFANGALPALIPYYKDRFGLSYTLAAVLILASTFSSSLIQPLFGLWSDRRGLLWLAPAGIAVGGIGIALAADAPSYWLVLILVVVSGIGVAAFHPEGSKYAAYASGPRRATGMAVFSVGGNVGYALGPLAATLLVAAFGLGGGILLVVPCAAAAAVFVARYRFLGSLAPVSGGRGTGEPEEQGSVRALTLLLAVIAFRSFAWFGLIAFVPLWEVSLGHSKSHGNHLLVLMLLTGAIGTLVAGPTADRIGRRPVLVASLVATPVLVGLFIVVGGTFGAICLALTGAFVIGTYGVTMVMSQEYLPNRIGMASGLSIGFSIGLGGIGAVVLGAVADSVNLETALWAAALAPLVVLPLALRLPPARRLPELRLLPVSEP